MKHPGGRPLKFESVEELQQKIANYFAECDPHVTEVKEYVEARDSEGTLLKDENGLNYLVEVTHLVKSKQVPYTITGLAEALETSRETLLDYESGKYDDPERTADDNTQFSDTIKKAKLRCENYAEQQLFSTTPTGTIFNLKNNYGWKDRTELDADLNVKDANLDGKQAEQLLRARRNRTDS